MSFDRILQFGFSTDRVESKDTASPEYRVMIGQNALVEIVKDFAAERDRVRADDRLTSLGQKDRIRAAGKEALTQVDELKPKTLDYLDKRYRDVQARFDVRCGLEPSENAHELMREIEARQYIKELGAEARVLVFDKAIQTNDVPTFRAFIHAPGFLNLLSPQLLDDGKRLWIEAQNPTAARELAVAERLFTLLRSNFEEVYIGLAAEAELQEAQDDLRSRLQRLSPEVSHHE